MDMGNLTPASTLTFVLARKLLERSLLSQLPFLCNFRANFAAALRDGKGTNAGQAVVRTTPSVRKKLINNAPTDLIFIQQRRKDIYLL